jgi:SAM-dependent methyltransferase
MRLQARVSEMSERLRASWACRLCGGKSQSFLQSRDFNLQATSKNLVYNRCCACHTVFLSQIPDDVSSLYPPDYYSVPLTVMDLAADSRFEQYKIDLVKEHAHGRRLMEVGPATGGFAYLAKQAGFDVHTIEMDSDCCRFLREEIGVLAEHTYDAVAALETSGSLDVIAFWHVLEHMPDPYKVIRTASHALRPGGIIVLAMPNPEALQFRLFRRFWVHLDAPRHIYLVPRASVVAWAKEFGLEVAFSSFTDAGAVQWNAFGWGRSIQNLLGRRIIRQRVLQAIGPLVAWISAPLERMGSLGCTYTLVLRRSD